MAPPLPDYRARRDGEAMSERKMKPSKHTFEVDEFSRVRATDSKDGGSIDDQSVIALLLYEILRELRQINSNTEAVAL